MEEVDFKFKIQGTHLKSIEKTTKKIPSIPISSSLGKFLKKVQNNGFAQN